MTATGFRMKASEVVNQARHPAAATGEWSGIGWTDSSWELMHGLDVVEDLPADAWPPELAPPAPPPVTAGASRQ